MCGENSHSNHACPKRMSDCKRTDLEVDMKIFPALPLTKCETIGNDLDLFKYLFIKGKDQKEGCNKFI